MTFAAFGFVPPMDEIGDEAMDQWLFHRGFETYAERRDAMKIAHEDTLSFLFGETMYHVRHSRVRGAAWFDVWFVQPTRSVR